MKLVHISPPDVYDSLRSRGYTQVVKAQDFSELIVLAGHMPYDPENRLVGAGDIDLQARTVFDNLKRSLAAAGAGLENVVRLTTYLTDLSAHAVPVRKIRAEYFGGAKPPASTMIEISKLPPGVLLEIEALAAR